MLHKVKSYVSSSVQESFDVLAKHKVPFLSKRRTSKSEKSCCEKMNLIQLLNLHLNSGISSNVSEILSGEQVLKTSRLSKKSSLLSMKSLLQSLTVTLSILQSCIGH